MKKRDMWIRIVDEVLKPAMPGEDDPEACLHLRWVGSCVGKWRYVGNGVPSCIAVLFDFTCRHHDGLCWDPSSALPFVSLRASWRIGKGLKPGTLITGAQTAPEFEPAGRLAMRRRQR
jgi:hypothetical protein